MPAVQEQSQNVSNIQQGSYGTQTGSTTQQYLATEEEKALQAQLLKQYMATSASTTTGNEALQSFLNNMISGNIPQTGLFSSLGGYTEDTIKQISNKAIGDALPYFQSLGLANSGAAFEAASNIAADTRSKAVEFNTNNASNLLNTVIGGQATQSATNTNMFTNLMNNLQGLRKFVSNTTGTDRTSTQQNTKGYSSGTYLTQSR